jgi:Domain of unknown function (DUF4149)
MWFMKFLMLLALIVWIGGIIFFAFVEAPTLFVVLPTHLAGNVVGVSLTKLHWIGLVAGITFLLCSLLYNLRNHAKLKLFGATHIFVLLMLVSTAVSQFSITYRMRQLRATMDTGDFPTPPFSVLRAEFDRLHVWSTRLEAGVLFLGLGVVILTARRFEKSN